MATVSSPRRSVRKPSVIRTIRVLEPGKVLIRVGKLAIAYQVGEFICGSPYDGRSFRLTKPDGETYDVFFDRFGQSDVCTCRGFEAHNHCKHHAALQALLHRGKLDQMPAITV